jgi:glycosyltransferase involved in cell wall biosynthesis
VNPKVILIDATSVGERITGIERYTRAVVGEIIKKAPNNDFRTIILLSRNVRGYEPEQNITLIYSPFNSRIITEQIWVPFVVYRIKPSVSYFPAFPPSPLIYYIVTEMKVIRTVYDAAMWRCRETLSWKNKIYMKPLETFGMSRYDFICTISNSAMRDIVDVFPAVKNKIANVGCGFDYDKFNLLCSDKNTDEFINELKLPESYILFVGTIEPRKNLKFLLAVISDSKMISEHIQLVIAGRYGWGAEEIFEEVEKLKLADNVHFLGAVDDKELHYIYKRATMLVFPSIYEGFGLPLLEAMACGIPVISANTASLPEVAGDAAILLSPTDRDSWVDAIKLLIKEPAARKSMIEKGFRQASKFSWNAVVCNILGTIRNMIC